MPAADWDKRTAFAKEYAASSNGRKAAIAAGVPVKSAHAVAYKWLRNTEVLALIREELDARLRDLGPVALDVLRDLMADPAVSSQTRLTAARDVLDRLGWVPPRRAEAMPLQASRSIEEMSVAELRAIVAQAARGTCEESKEVEGITF